MTTTAARSEHERRRQLLEAMGLAEFALSPGAPTTTRSAAPSDTPAPPASADRALERPAASPTPSPASATPALEGHGAYDSLDALHAAVRSCRACGLCETRKQAVPGVGHAQAQWMIVGEGPGEQEDLLGEPFVGPSGALLDAMLAALDLGRQPGSAAAQVFIANAVKCRPPGNRTPRPEELSACRPFLRQQLALVRPRMVLALGRVAAQSLLDSDAPIGKLRGKVHRLDDGTPVVVSYHPAYLLRQPLEKARAWEDLCLAASQLMSGAPR